MFEKQTFEMAVQAINPSQILIFQIANGYQVDTTAEQSEAIAQFLHDLGDSVTAQEAERVRELERVKAEKKKLMIDSRRERVQNLISSKAIAAEDVQMQIKQLTLSTLTTAEKLDSQIKDIIKSIPDDERTPEERELVGDAPKARVGKAKAGK